MVFVGIGGIKFWRKLRKKKKEKGSGGGGGGRGGGGVVSLHGFYRGWGSRVLGEIKKKKKGGGKRGKRQSG